MINFFNRFPDNSNVPLHWLKNDIWIENDDILGQELSSSIQNRIAEDINF